MAFRWRSGGRARFRIVIAAANFLEKSYRGRKEIGRSVLFIRTKNRITQETPASADL